MRDLNQEILKFNFEKNFKNEDFYVSKSNEHIFNFVNKWPNWEKISLISLVKNFLEKPI